MELSSNLSLKFYIHVNPVINITLLIYHPFLRCSEGIFYHSKSCRGDKIERTHLSYIFPKLLKKAILRVLMFV